MKSSSMVAEVDGVVVLKGAAAIAEFLFGERHRRREIYYLVEREGLPHFKLGTMICARPATLLSWITDQERGLS